MRQEVDELWEKLSEGGKKDRCGWLKDKYGLSWQIIPSALGKMLRDKDPEKSKKVMEECCKWTKLTSNVCRRQTRENNSGANCEGAISGFIVAS
jgi:predicted 3-demethylubiquinone-9 3-methyltransferase (glyoxalase superfamily)